MYTYVPSFVSAANVRVSVGVGLRWTKITKWFSAFIFGLHFKLYGMELF
jgi:hypothetical protein